MSDKPLTKFEEGTPAKVDVIGTGEWVYGTIHSANNRSAQLKPADGSKIVKAPRKDFLKATKKELKEFANAAAEANAEYADEERDTEGRTVVADLGKYVFGGPDGDAKTPTGRKTVDINDPVAENLRSLSLDEVYKVVARNLKALGKNTIGSKGEEVKVTVASLQERYAHLNVGMQRMSLGNLVRGAMKEAGVDTLPE